MNDFVAGVARLLLRMLLVGMGLVLLASLLVAALVLALAWVLRSAWARLTGRPVTPWAMRWDPRTGFRAVFRATERWSAGRHGKAPAGDADRPEAAASRRGGILPGAAEVTDVEARDVR